MNNLMTKYNNSLSSSRDITKELGSLNVLPGKNLTQALEVEVGTSKISIWKIFEVIVAIHYMPDQKHNKFKNFYRLARSHVISFYDALKNSFNNKHSRFKNHLKSENVFFLGFTGYLAYENFDLIFDEILADKKYKPFWIDDIDVSDYSKDKEHINSKKIHNKSIRRNAHRIKKDINKQLNNIVKAIRPKISTNPKLRLLLSTIEYLKPLILNVLAQDISRAYYLLSYYSPSAIISIDVADPRNRIFTLLANNLDIPVIQIQAGAINQECIEWSFCYDDLMLSHGPHVKDELVKLGFDKNKIIETGSSKIEKSINTMQSKRRVLRDRFNINDDKVLILFLTSYIDLFDTQKILNNQKTVYRDIYYSVIEEVKNNPNLSLIIKPHPLEKKHQLKEHSNESLANQNIKVANPSDNSSEMMSGADVIVSFGSTATIDAIVYGKPVICPKFHDFPLNKYIEESNAVLVPKNAQELNYIFEMIDQGNLSEIINQCKNGREIFLKDFTNLNSSPTKKIVSCIYKTKTHEKTTQI